jgi:transcriptional regulator with XRE-family HTH domain
MKIYIFMNIIRELRTKSGLSQKQLAEKAGLFQPTIARIETGKQRPKQRTIERLEKALGQKVNFVEDDLTLRSASFYTCQKVLKRLVEMKLALSIPEQQELSKIVKQYFI